MSRRKLALIAGLVIAVLFGVAKAGERAYTPPILMYHSVAPGADFSNRLNVSPESLEKQMHFLRRLGYNIVTVEELAGVLRRGEKIPPRTVAITFDDGYKNNYTYAFPVLKKYRIPVTLFIIVNEVGRPQNDRLDWSEIEEMQKSGLVIIGSHALGPDPLIKLTDEQVVSEIFDSKKALSDRLGVEVGVFSYPEGMYTPRIKQLVKEAGYTTAVATNPGKASAGDDIFALKRLRIGPSADNLFVFWLESSGFYTFIKEHRKK
jgi:peptidoglycan/xylan/chitin deacetylase (PgdA/CDA1 family)